MEQLYPESGIAGDEPRYPEWQRLGLEGKKNPKDCKELKDLKDLKDRKNAPETGSYPCSPCSPLGPCPPSSIQCPRFPGRSHLGQGPRRRQRFRVCGRAGGSAPRGRP